MIEHSDDFVPHCVMLIGSMKKCGVYPFFIVSYSDDQCSFQGQLTVRRLSLGDSGKGKVQKQAAEMQFSLLDSFRASQSLSEQIILFPSGNYSCLPSYTTPDMVVVHITTGFPHQSGLSLFKFLDLQTNPNPPFTKTFSRGASWTSAPPQQLRH